VAHAAIATKPRPGGDMHGNQSDTMGTMERIAGIRTASPLSMFRDPAWCVALAATIAFAVSVRGAMLFRGEVPAGVDAGYYAVQARELLLLGKLRWADVPLTFLLDAALAKVAMLVCGWDIDTATVWATRVVDAVSEPLVAVAVFVAAWTFARGARGAIMGAVAVAIAVTVSPPLLRMVGDFEKQSMAYAFMASTWTCAWLAMRAVDRRGMFRWSAAALVMLGLTALTHAGTFAATGLGTVLVFAVWVTRGGIPRGMALRALLVMGLVGGLAYGAVWWLAPGKALAISTMISTLISGEGGGPGGSMRGPRGPGGPSGPGGPGALSLGVVWSLALAAGFAFVWWTTRHLRRAESETRGQARADEAFLFGMVLAAACLTCPVLGGDQSMRLALMVPVPLAFVAAFVFCERVDDDAASRFVRGTRWIVQRPIATLAALALAVSAVGGTHGRTPEMVDAEAMAQLRSWRAEMAPGDRAVVAARHGLEFWAAFAMDTHARWGTLKQEDFDSYDRFFILEERRGGRGGPGGAGDMMDEDFPPRRRPGPADMGEDTRIGMSQQQQRTRPDSRGSGRPDRRRVEPSDGMAEEGPRRRGGPPDDMGGPGGPGGPGGRGGPRRGPGGGPGGDPMSVVSVPREARIVKQSDRFTLWEVPASARERFPTREQANNRAQQGPR
jgi:hypothetical protein